jgi:hypothetical protein
MSQTASEMYFNRLCYELKRIETMFYNDCLTHSPIEDIKLVDEDNYFLFDWCHKIRGRYYRKNNKKDRLFE